MKIFKQFNQKQLVTWFSIVIVSFIAIYGLWKLTTKNSKPIQIALNKKDHIYGVSDSKVVIVEFSDFQCPACKYYHSLIKPIVEKYKKQITFVYRNFPLDQHKLALPAAAVAEAAGQQNKFFEMHDKLFENQDEWSALKDPGSQFKKYATDLKLDINKWEKDINGTDVKSKIDMDITSAREIGINQTPTFYLNGQQMGNFSSASEFDKLIQSALSN
ncbi:hypothetical protein A3C23_05905 [Candidatus Roizmanbacteria bacterium RIFCSPHIGHO2_02_FULL_37_13b]|uniref:Thioredoxin domain-containing protein n=1 Tax=Candidatus Roizmanbacteria bacterium RIFCSPLOWO2_02_FULL_36_11 TaxID=1802071 RepID=A0A1F7JCR4_9BACT|nr:MAG: hypothetical protein A3C23_05905 [Candidatus Roizmanbacteria bacterium RIFCSPHIGHO2_02_FULL_37_13b]OGK53398.1 MAG: hypothetical protein A3H78_02545 [Candidatus Roizmanbacteria bacterium RIFCSPLOWO2_02_FULL_36_11]